jgi:hypothetical protein
LVANAETVSCAGATCDVTCTNGDPQGTYSTAKAGSCEGHDVDVCCRAPCADLESCEGDTMGKLVGHALGLAFCEGPFCDAATDTHCCCEEKETCEDYPCPDSHMLREDAASLLCYHSECEEDEGPRRLGMMDFSHPMY